MHILIKIYPVSLFPVLPIDDGGDAETESGEWAAHFANSSGRVTFTHVYPAIATCVWGTYKYGIDWTGFAVG